MAGLLALSAALLSGCGKPKAEPAEAEVEDVPEETTSFDHESEQNLEAARAYSENTNNLPYILIGGAGLVVFLLILWRIIKIAKS